MYGGTGRQDRVSPENGCASELGEDGEISILHMSRGEWLGYTSIMGMFLFRCYTYNVKKRFS